MVEECLVLTVVLPKSVVDTVYAPAFCITERKCIAEAGLTTDLLKKVEGLVGKLTLDSVRFLERDYGTASADLSETAHHQDKKLPWYC